MSVDLLKKRLSGKSNQAIIKAIEKSARTGLDLVESILTYGRGVAGERKKVKVGRLVENAVSTVRRGVRANIRIKQDLKSQRWQVLGDASQLKQVIRNLCVNACDAMPDGGVLRVEARDMDVNEARVADLPNAMTGRYVTVTVSDTGKGISLENLDRIFEPFFTTKADNGGTGMGLSVAQGIVRSHNGFITVASKTGEGAAFCVYLPALSENVSR